MPRGRATRLATTSAGFALTQIALTLAGLGTVALPRTPVSGSANVTVLELPAILAGVLGGALPGFVVGLVFGALTFFRATTPLFHNAIIAVAPRLLVGLVAYAAYRGLRRVNLVVALIAAGALGALANSGLVLALAVVLAAPNGANYLPDTVAWEIFRASAPLEVLVAIVVTLAVGVVAHGAGLRDPA